MDAYQINPALVEKLVAEKDDKGNFRYSADEINILTSIHKDMPELYEIAKATPARVLKLSQQRSSTGEIIYSTDDIKNILEIEANGTEYAKYLIKMKDFSSKDSRFTPKQIKFLMKKHQDFPEVIESLVEEKHRDKSFRYSAKEIIETTKLINDKNVDAVKTLINKKTDYEYRKNQ